MQQMHRKVRTDYDTSNNGRHNLDKELAEGHALPYATEQLSADAEGEGTEEANGS